MNKISTAVSVCALFFLSACGGSEKGNWSDSEKEQVRKELTAERGALDSTLGKAETDLWIECTMTKIEAAYENYAAASSDEKGVEKIGETCAIEVLTDSSSKKGAWSAGDRERLLKEMNEQRGQLEPTFGKEKTELWIQCAVNRTESSFQNYVAANGDLSMMEKIGADCAIEVMKAP